MKVRRMLQGCGGTVACSALLVLACSMVRSILSIQGEDMLPQLVAENYKPARSINSATHLFGGLDYTLPFPVYYINMDGSEDRRKRTELLFGDLWNLRRSPAVAGSDSEALMRLLGADNYQRVVSYIQRERNGDEAVGWNEVGCTLSHLTTIRMAYLENQEMVMIMEDDVSPALMPFWSSSVVDLVEEANSMNSSTPWSLIQAGWTWFRDYKIYTNNRPQPGRHLFQEKFQFGLIAYIISKSGMETILDTYFSDRSSTGLIRLMDPVGVAEWYFDVLQSGVYVSLPSLFTILEGESVIAGRDEGRLNIHLRSNNIHMHETLQMAFERLQNQSTWADN